MNVTWVSLIKHRIAKYRAQFTQNVTAFKTDEYIFKFSIIFMYNYLMIHIIYIYIYLQRRHICKDAIAELGL